jgi:hypothetical protein
MPFGKSIFLHITVNIELGRENPKLFARWLKSLRLIMKRPSNIITANNLYDLEYTRMITGVVPEYLPTLALYASKEGKSGFERTSNTILIGKNEYTSESFWQEMKKETSNMKFIFRRIHEVYSNYAYADLQAHPAVLIIPYTKSIMSFFEYYALNIPIFVPSVELLYSWDKNYRVMKERVYWQQTPLRNPLDYPIMPPFGTVPSVNEYTPIQEMCDFPEGFQLPKDNWPMPHPNDITDPDAMSYWIRKSDYYTWPHIQHFSSWEDLKNQLNSPEIESRLLNISISMRNYHQKVVRFAYRKWKSFENRIKSANDYMFMDSFERSMKHYYTENSFSDEALPCHSEPMFP